MTLELGRDVARSCRLPGFSGCVDVDPKAVAERCRTRRPASGSASLRISSIRPRVAMVA
jgi:hypothetical protein